MTLIYNRASITAVVLGAIFLISSPIAALAIMALSNGGRPDLIGLFTGLLVFLLEIAFGMALVKLGWKKIPDPDSLNYYLKEIMQKKDLDNPPTEPKLKVD